MGSAKKRNTVKKLADKLSAAGCAMTPKDEEAYARTSVADESIADDNTDESVEELFEHYRFVVDKGQSMMRIDKYITFRMTDTSRSRVQMAIEAGYVRIGGVVVKSNYKVKPLDEISLVFPYEKRVRDIGPENIPLDIVYEDDDLMVINKPAGLVVHPGHGHFSGTLVNAVAYHLTFGDHTRNDGPEKISPEKINPEKINPNEIAPEDVKHGILVHRIDKDTSGLLLIAKTEEAQLKLAKQFFYHTTSRKYVAIVWGNVEEDEGTVDTYICRDESDRMRFTVCKDGSRGKRAITHYKVLERYGYVTVVECVLETGRTHQIRVHMRYLGHPLFNDERYGGNKILSGTVFTKYRQFIENCFAILPRQGLHAKTLGFDHPTTGRRMSFDSEIPADMKALIEKMRAYKGTGI